MDWLGDSHVEVGRRYDEERALMTLAGLEQRKVHVAELVLAEGLELRAVGEAGALRVPVLRGG